MLSREDTLFELKVDAILAENFGEELAFYLLDEFVDGITESEISLIGWMRVEVQIHEEPFLFAVVLAQLADCIAGRLFLRIWSRIVSI